MQPEQIKNKGQARLFENPFLESLTKTRPWVIYVLYIPVCMYMLYYSYGTLGFSIGRVLGVFFFAFFFWTLFEYFAHRYLFHYEPKSKIGQRIVYIFHGNHHEYPRDKMRLFMPPVPSIILASVIFAIIWFSLAGVIGDPNYTFMFFPGFMIGYLAYVSMHYAIHAFAPPKYLKALWRNHHLHHYKYPEKGFGVSSTFWDMIFRTVPEKK
ncbi:fatty acid hydroxylase [Pseudopedobacter saltans DSM 12145]|uniref:Fatty acid hydroxylase n=1 Tax=Pseudopedobacter saltans (strain ATCC 51119 / DSM 12145 / JCM 21818 / CCUG 39354 / LMG 10337 / NBRC 100064 / NCIMB 13643) TaxID=762903 RepID=F0S5P9_PSESL|nr:sterol desaturase family protein [Pseudopedobacter saltans]ADY54223.1 fatty acid hydroxylase [Pseudopedobacter saltans DSM 12145]